MNRVIVQIVVVEPVGMWATVGVSEANGAVVQVAVGNRGSERSEWSGYPRGLWSGGGRASLRSSGREASGRPPPVHSPRQTRHVHRRLTTYNPAWPSGDQPAVGRLKGSGWSSADATRKLIVHATTTLTPTDGLL